MGLAYAVRLILVYLLVVAQFRSYLVPRIIMAPIPLTIIGVMPGHALLGAQFTATSMIGMMALAGMRHLPGVLVPGGVTLPPVTGEVAEDWVENNDELLRKIAKTDKTRWARTGESCRGVSEETTTGVLRLYQKG